MTAVPSIAEPGQAADPSGRQLPNGAQVTAGIERSLDRESEARAQLWRQGAVNERVESRSQYSSLGAADASALLQSEFAEQLEKLDTDPARFLSTHRLEDRLDPTSAVVRVGGEPQILDAGIPVLAQTRSGPEKVDLSLRDTGNGFVPRNPLVDLRLPAEADGSIEIGGTGLTLTPLVVDGSPGQVLGDLSLFYPNVQRDTDLLAAPSSWGVEIFNQLRSPQSPESWAFLLQGPSGSEVRADASGGAEVVDDSGVVAKVHPPTAVDAQGRDVPVEMTVEGDALRLTVSHRGSEFAYPILVDPLVEDWQTASWFHGGNLDVLDAPGFWIFNRNAAWIQGKTGCIFFCPAARGLFVSGESGGSRGANQFGQWSYTPPGGSTRVVQYSLSPFWRENHGCSAGQHPQPHDYVGLWTGTAWFGGGPQVNQANNVGAASGTGVGRDLIFGLGSGGGIASMPCWRDIYLGGVAIWIDDPDWPGWNGNPSIEDRWIAGNGLPISVSSTDAGIGVKYYNVFKTDANGAIAGMIGNAVHPCSGLRKSPCPSTWATQVGFNPAQLEEGIRVLGVQAYDAFGAFPIPPGPPHHSELRTVIAKVDRSKPVISTVLGGFVSSGTPSFELIVLARDGAATSLQTARSGVERIKLFFDGELIEEKVVPCVNVPPGAQINWGSCELKYEAQLNGNLTGSHEVKLIAVDGVGHASDPQIRVVDIPSDQHKPTVSVHGPLSKRVVTRGNQLLEISAEDAQTGVRKLELFIDGQSAWSETQGCPTGACSMERGVVVDVTDFPGGSHPIRVVATDDRGNKDEEAWQFRIDDEGPQLEPIVAEGPLAGWIVNDQTVSFKVRAADPSSVDRFEVTRPADKALGAGQVEVTTHQTAGATAEATIEFPTDGMLPGINTVKVKAFDNPGNVSTIATIDVRIDRTAPVITVMSGPFANTNAALPLARFSDVQVKVTDTGGGIQRMQIDAPKNLGSTVITDDELNAQEAQTCSNTAAGRVCEVTYEFPTDLGPVPIPTALPQPATLRVVDQAGRIAVKSNTKFLDNVAPTITLKGPLATAHGKELEAAEAELTVEARDPNPSQGQTNPLIWTPGMQKIVVLVDDEVVRTAALACTPQNCPATLTTKYTYKKADWEPGPHLVTVRTYDEVGNMSEDRIAVDAPITDVAPACPQSEPEQLPASNVVSSAAAETAAALVVPGAMAPSQPLAGSDEAEEDDPVLEPAVTKADASPVNGLGIDVVGTETGGGIEDGQGASFTVGQAVCMAPVTTTPAQSEAVIVNGDSVLFANSAPSTDTIIRPTAYGTTVTQSLRDDDAPDSFEWDLHLEPGQVLEQLPNGDIAVVEPDGNGHQGTEVPPAPVGEMNPALLGDVAVQLDLADHELTQAENHVTGSVVAVIGAPLVVLDDKSTVPGVIVKSSATSIKISPPPGAVDEAVALVMRANASAEPTAICAQLYGGAPEDYYEGCGPIKLAEEEAAPAPEVPEDSSFDGLPVGNPALQQLLQRATNGVQARREGEEEIPADAREADLMFCSRDGLARRGCPWFIHDGLIALEASGRLWNVRAEGVKSDAFEHSLWAALAIQSNVIDMGEEVEDLLALEFLRNHEEHKHGLFSPSVTERYGSRMDLMNNTAGILIEQEVDSDLGACELALPKARAGIHIGSGTNPLKWGKKHNFEARKVIYRHKRYNGIVVGALASGCLDVGIF